MMREETRMAIERLRETVGDRHFTADDTKGIVSINTLRKYGLIKSEQYEARRTEYSMAELIAELNDREGMDCWYDFDDGFGEWIIEDGRAFYTWRVWGYRFI